MTVRDRKTHYPSRYRVCIPSIAGELQFDYLTEAEARREAGRDGVVLAQWFCTDEDGRTYIDSERLP